MNELAHNIRSILIMSDTNEDVIKEITDVINKYEKTSMKRENLLLRKIIYVFAHDIAGVLSYFFNQAFNVSYWIDEFKKNNRDDNRNDEIFNNIVRILKGFERNAKIFITYVRVLEQARINKKTGIQKDLNLILEELRNIK